MPLIYIDRGTFSDSLRVNPEQFREQVSDRIEGGDIAKVMMPNGTEMAFDDEAVWADWHRSLELDPEG